MNVVRTPKRQIPGRERGQSLVELAIALPLFLIVLLGIIDFGRVFYAYVTITNASREGARYGSLHPLQEADIKQRVMDEAASTVTINNSEITVSWDDPDHPDTITVTVNHDFETLFFGNLPLVKDWFPAEGRIPIRAQTGMPVAPAPPP